MTGPFDCEWEQDLLDALQSRRWPARCDDALRAHVAGCAACADLADAAGALLNDPFDDDVRVPVPPSSLVWWRAQLRAREQAAVAAARPMHLAIGAAAASAVAFLLALVIFFAAPAGAAINNAAAWLGTLEFGEMVGRAAGHPGLLFAVAGWIVIAPLALYMALGRE